MREPNVSKSVLKKSVVSSVAIPLSIASTVAAQDNELSQNQSSILDEVVVTGMSSKVRSAMETSYGGSYWY